MTPLVKQRKHPDLWQLWELTLVFIVAVALPYCGYVLARPAAVDAADTATGTTVLLTPATDTTREGYLTGQGLRSLLSAISGTECGWTKLRIMIGGQEWWGTELGLAVAADGRPCLGIRAVSREPSTVVTGIRTALNTRLLPGMEYLPVLVMREQHDGTEWFLVGVDHPANGVLIGQTQQRRPVAPSVAWAAGVWQ